MGQDSNDDPWWYDNRQRKVSIDDDAVSAFIARLSRDLAPGLEFAVVVGSDEATRRANSQFRGKAGATDVLSFPDGEDGRLGDVLISAARAQRQASDYGHSVDAEVKTLVLHGLLHLLGHDHEADSGEMAEQEERLRKRYRLPAGVIKRVQTC